MELSHFYGFRNTIAFPTSTILGIDVLIWALLQVEGPYLMWKSLASDDILGLWIYKVCHAQQLMSHRPAFCNVVSVFPIIESYAAGQEEEHAVICKLVMDIVQVPSQVNALPPLSSDALPFPTLVPRTQ